MLQTDPNVPKPGITAKAALVTNGATTKYLNKFNELENGGGGWIRTNVR